MENKPYFAKYLPVEGEPKGCDCKGMCEADEPLEVNCRKYRRNELFLCSRDIKVGDKAWSVCHGESREVLHDGKDARGEIWALYSHDTGSSVGKSTIHIPKASAIKVIGPISSEATWVKEDDEFDRASLRILHPGFRAEGKNGPMYEFKGETIEEPYIITIKGTCGYFH